MEGSAPEKVHRIPVKETGKVVQFVPEQEEKWIERVVGHTRQMEPAFQKAHATPHANKPIPKSKDLEQVGAEIVGAEPDFSEADAKYFIETVVDPKGGLLAGERTIPGNKVIHYLRRKFRLLKQKAA